MNRLFLTKLNTFLKIRSNYCSYKGHYSKFIGNQNLKKNIVNSTRTIMDLASVVKAIEKIVPAELAEDWDNTGLLIGPSSTKKVTTVLLTIDLTENVLEEALSFKTDLILAYHPPIFSSVKLFQSHNWKDRIVMSCIAGDIAVYSPHTACDAIKGGVNDWLISCFDLDEVVAIKKIQEPSNNIFEFNASLTVNLETLLSNYPFKVLRKCAETTMKSMERYKILVGDSFTGQVFGILSREQGIGDINIQPCKSLLHQSIGMGRRGKLRQPTKISDCIRMVKEHVKLDKIRFSIGRGLDLDTEISTIAACAGSGSSILKNEPSDVYVTGEMSHHDILDAIHNGRSVILCEHSNSERGYLQKLMNDLVPLLPGVKLVISSLDKDPLSLV